MPEIELIIKTSKLCNLRCTYCYETPELANKARMSLEDIRRMFLHLRSYIWSRSVRDYRLRLLWHGGEPFAQPISYWEAILKLEEEVFGKRFRKRAITNDVQSNLTLITEKHLPILRQMRVGFSYDVLNDFRVNAAGRPTDDLVRRKIEWLQKEGIPIGGIAVVSKANVDHPDEVAGFFVEKGIPFRALQIYHDMDKFEAIRNVAVPFERYLQFLMNLSKIPTVQTLLEAGRCPIEPFAEAKRTYSTWKRGGKASLAEEECFVREWALGVNTNGDIYSPGDMYNEEYRYGNIFRQSLDEVLVSVGRGRRIKRSKERMKEICFNCPFFRHGCFGTFVSHATREEYRGFQRVGCCFNSYVARRFMEQEAGDVSSSPKIVREATLTC